MSKVPTQSQLLHDRIAASWERALEMQLPPKEKPKILSKRSVLAMDDDKRIKYQSYKHKYYLEHKDEFKARYEKNKEKAHERYLLKKANKLKQRNADGKQEQNSV